MPPGCFFPETEETPRFFFRIPCARPHRGSEGRVPRGKAFRLLHVLFERQRSRNKPPHAFQEGRRERRPAPRLGLRSASQTRTALPVSRSSRRKNATSSNRGYRSIRQRFLRVPNRLFLPPATPLR